MDYTSWLLKAGVAYESEIYSKGGESSQDAPLVLLEKLRDVDDADEAHEVVSSIATALWYGNDTADDLGVVVRVDGAETREKLILALPSIVSYTAKSANSKLIGKIEPSDALRSTAIAWETRLFGVLANAPVSLMMSSKSSAL